MGLVCTKIHRFVEYTPKKCFKSFVQSAVEAKKQGDENPNSSVVAETMKLLANSSYCYQIIDRSRHTVTKYLIDEKTHAAIISELFKKLDHVNNSLFEVELPEAQIEHKEQIIVGFFMLQWAKLRMSELYYNFFTRFCDGVEELEPSSKSGKWTQTRCISLLPRKNWKIVQDVKWELNGRGCDQMTVSIISLMML